MSSRNNLVVYGATGATGHRIVELAVAAGLNPIVAGRRREPLEQLAAPSGLEVRTGGLDALDDICDGARVVVNCVGPYTRLGQPVLDAALRQHAHYVDCSGEPRWVQNIIDNHDAQARALGCALVPGVGLGIAIDLAARVAAAEIGNADDVDDITVAYRIIGMRPSTASMRSTVELVAAGAPIVDHGHVTYRRVGAKVRRMPTGPAATFATPDPLSLSLMWPNAHIECYIQSNFAVLFFPALAAGGLVLKNGIALRAARRLANRSNAASANQARGKAIVTAVATGAGRSGTAIATVSELYEITSQAVFAVASSLLINDIEPGVRAMGQVLGEPVDVARALGIGLECRTERRLTRVGQPTTQGVRHDVNTLTD